MWDTEDKTWWCKHGAKREVDFVERVAPELKLDAQINPDKETDPYLPDLIVNGRLADLKCQNTPFFKAQTFFKSEVHPQGIDPQYAISFNRKDYLRYKEHYPELDVYFWVDWEELTKFGITVRPMRGIYRMSFAQLARSIEAEEAKLHHYQRRQGDMRGNARNSYGFDVREFEALFHQWLD